MTTELFSPITFPKTRMGGFSQRKKEKKRS